MKVKQHQFVCPNGSRRPIISTRTFLRGGAEYLQLVNGHTNELSTSIESEHSAKTTVQTLSQY